MIKFTKELFSKPRKYTNINISEEIQKDSRYTVIDTSNLTNEEKTKVINDVFEGHFESIK